MNDKSEAIRFVVVAGIAMLVSVCLGLCALVPYLLKDAKPMDLKIIAILLTGIAPGALIGFVLFSLW